MFHLSAVPARFLSILPFLLAAASAETLATPRLTCEVAQDAQATTITAREKSGADAVVFRVGWHSSHGKAEGFMSSKAENGAITSTHRIGKTTVTRTILASAAADCILIHVIADQPGAVSLSARFLSQHPARIVNRREILLSAGKIHAHAWILPFEADVHDNGKDTVSLQGEGEALILLNLTADPEAAPISETLKRLGRIHDPGHNPPSPHLIWEGVLGNERMRVTLPPEPSLPPSLHPQPPRIR